MAPSHPILPSFASGVLSPSLHSRTDLQKYGTGLKTGKNFFIHPHGGASNRPGLEYRATVKDPTKKTRIIPFTFSTEQSYVIETGEGYFRFFKEGAAIAKSSVAIWLTSTSYNIGDFVTESSVTYMCIEAHTSGTFATDLAADKWVAQSVYEIVNPFVAADLPDIKWAQSADVMYMVHGSHIPKKLTRYGHDNWTLEDYPLTNGPFMLSNPIETKTLSLSETSDPSGTPVSGFSVNITAELYVEIGKTAHGLEDNDTVSFASVDGACADILNGNTFTVGYLTENTFKLYYLGTSTRVQVSLYTTSVFDDFSGTSGLWTHSEMPVGNPNNHVTVRQGASGGDLVWSVDSGTDDYTDNGTWTATSAIGISTAPLARAYGGWEFQYDAAVANTSVACRFIWDGVNGYSVIVDGANGYLKKDSTTLISWTRTEAAETVTVKVTRSEAGLFEVFVNSSSQGTHTDNTVTTNTQLSAAAGGMWDVLEYAGITISQVSQWTSISAPINSYTPGAGEYTPSTNVTLTANFDAFYPTHVGGLWRLRHDIEGQTVATSFTSATAGTSIKCGGTWRLTTRGTWTGTIQIQKSIDGGTTWSNIRAFKSVADYNVDTYGDISEDIALVRIEMTAYTSGTCNVTLTTDPFTQTAIFKTKQYTSATVIKGSLIAPAGATTATHDWAEGSWSDYRGFPESIAFAQDRLCFGGSRSEPQTVWESETGNYESHLRSDPLLDSDGITINLPSRKMNAIRNMVTLADLMAFTSSSEFSISGGSSSAMTPTTIETRVHGYRGASGVDPVVIGNRALVVAPMGTVVRDIGYDFGSNGYTGDSISIMSSHFFDGKEVLGMAYAQEPDSLVWVYLDDGSFLALTYMREQEVLAWTEQETDGEVEDICSIPGDGYDEVWFVVKRNINGSDTRYIERLKRRMETTVPADQFFVDCGLTYDGEAATTITGLDHLEGETVSILGDGAVYAQQVVTGGEITIDPAAAKVHVGLPYNCDLETLNIEMPMRGGTMQGMFVQVASVIIRLLNTVGGYVGPDADSLDPIVLRTSEPLGSPTNLFSGDAEQSLNAGYSKGGRVFIRQSDPLPITVLAVIPVVAVGG